MTYIVIEGVIGVGKTALTRMLGEHQGFSTLFEQFEENPFLGNFYQDRERYAFQTETFFLLNRYRQQQAALRPALEAGNVVSDYLFAKTRLFAGLNLQGDELMLFEELFGALSERIARPDLVVFLQASVDTLMARIYQRDRSFERNMDPNYIAMLVDLYNSYFSNYSATPLLKIDSDPIDFVRDPASRTGVIRAIMDATEI